GAAARPAPRLHHRRFRLRHRMGPLQRRAVHRERLRRARPAHPLRAMRPMLCAALYRAKHADDDRREARNALLTGSAIVTGGGSGVGRATALALASAGWRVMIAGRRRDALEAVCAEGGGALSAATCDVSDEASVQALFAAA